MVRGPDPVKLQQWRERLARFEKSPRTVADFCTAEGVSQATFYVWKGRLARTSRPKAAPDRRRRQKPPQASPGFQAVIVTPRPDAANVTIRLPQGIVVELGNDLRTLETVVRELLNHQATTGPAAC